MKKTLKSICPIVACSSLLIPLVSASCNKKENNVIEVNYRYAGVDDSLRVANPITLKANQDIKIESNLYNLSSFGTWDWWCIWFDKESVGPYPYLEVQIKSLNVKRLVRDPETREIKTITLDVLNCFDMDKQDDGYKVFFKNKGNDEEFGSLNVNTDTIECIFSLNVTLEDALIYVEKVSLFQSNRMTTDFEIEPQYGVSKLQDPVPSLYSIYYLKEQFEEEDWQIKTIESLWSEDDPMYKDFVKIPKGYYYDRQQKCLVTPGSIVPIESGTNPSLEFWIKLQYPEGSNWYLPQIYLSDAFAFPFRVTAEKGNETHQEYLTLRLANTKWMRTPMDNPNYFYKRAEILDRTKSNEIELRTRKGDLFWEDEYSAAWVRAKDLGITEEEHSKDFSIVLESEIQGLKADPKDFKVFVDYKEYTVGLEGEATDFILAPDASEEGSKWTITWNSASLKTQPDWKCNSSFKIISKFTKEGVNKYDLVTHFVVPLT